LGARGAGGGGRARGRVPRPARARAVCGLQAEALRGRAHPRRQAL
jgi:hypothetical protein